MSINLKNIQQQKPVKNTTVSSTKRWLEILNKDLSFNTNFPDKKKERFYAEISLLLTAGTDMKTALELIVDETDKEKDRKLLETIKDDIINGSSFSEALKSSGKFTEYEYYSLKVGEESSRVDLVLNDLANFYKRRIEQKRKLSSTLSYPIVLILSSFGMVIFLLKFLVPMFQDIFKNFDKELPALTKMVVKFSETIGDYFVLITLIFVGSGLFIYSQRNQLWFKKIWSFVLLRIPVVGEVVQKVYLTRFCHSMNLLISAKNPLLHSIQLVNRMIDFYPIQQALATIEDDLLHGKSLHESMRAFPIFPKKMTSLIKVAEEVNKLEAIFKNLDEQYGRELEHKSEVMGKLLEPILILFISVIVGIIVIAMYLPMMEINTGLF